MIKTERLSNQTKPFKLGLILFLWIDYNLTWLLFFSLQSMCKFVFVLNLNPIIEFILIWYLKYIDLFNHNIKTINYFNRIEYKKFIKYQTIIYKFLNVSYAWFLSIIRQEN